MSEQQAVGRPVLVSRAVYRLFMSLPFAGNVGDVKNVVKASCANAFLMQDTPKGPLAVRLSCLPAHLLEAAMDSGRASIDDEILLALDELARLADKNSVLTQLTRRLKAVWEEGKREGEARLLQQLVNALALTLNGAGDQEKNVDRQCLAKSVVANQAIYMKDRYALALHANDEDLLCRYWARRLVEGTRRVAQNTDKSLGAVLPRIGICFSKVRMSRYTAFLKSQVLRSSQNSILEVENSLIIKHCIISIYGLCLE